MRTWEKMESTPNRQAKETINIYVSWQGTDV